MALAACQELVENYSEISSMDGVFKIAQLIEGVIDCSSLVWVWGLHQPVLAGMILGGFGFGLLGRVLRSRKLHPKKRPRNPQSSRKPLKIQP